MGGFDLFQSGLRLGANPESNCFNVTTLVPLGYIIHHVSRISSRPAAGTRFS